MSINIRRSQSVLLRTLARFFVPVFLLMLLAACATPAATPESAPPPAESGSYRINARVQGQSAPQNRPDLYPINDYLSFEHFSLEQGLSSNLAQAVLQDRQGFLWFGTLEGLNKYDGYEVTVYRPEPGNPNSLSDTVINGLYEDRAGNIWVATTNGLNRFDPASETFTRYQHDPDDPTTPSSNAFSVVDGFYEDEQGYLWFSTWTAGLNRFDPASETFTRYQHDPDDPASLLSDGIIKMVPSVDGAQLWLATGRGLSRFDLEQHTSSHFRHDPTNPNSLSADEVNSVYATTLDGQPVVWAGTGDGQLNQFDPLSETFTHHTVGRTKITAIYEADNGLLWLGTQGEGIFIFDPLSGSVLGQYHNEPGDPGSLSANLVNHIHQDQVGALWIATYTGGMSRLDPWQKAFQLYQHQPNNPASLSSSDVSALDFAQDGMLWVGTFDNGLNRFDPTSATSTRYQYDPNNPDSLSHNLVTDVLADSRGLVWVATVGGGLNRFDPTTSSFTHYRHDDADPNSILSNGILTIFEDSDGMIWIGTTDAGLSQLDPESDTFSHYQPDRARPGSLSDVSISAIFEDSQGYIWVGSKQGLDRFDPMTQEFMNYRHDDDDPNSLSHNYVKAIVEDDAGILWLATDVGLNRFDPQTEQFRHYFTRDGLPHDQVSSIVADDEGHLWLGTSGGLSRFDPESETFRNYNRHDGLQGDIFYPYAVARDSNGTLYLGGSNGLSVFQPTNLIDKPYPPQVVLTEFQLFNEPVTPGSSDVLPRQIGFVDEITLEHDQSIIGFEFVALNYTAPEKNQYAYMLEGFDADWTYTDSRRRFARYTNLDPGHYTFRVKASNNDGVWNETGASVGLVITPPWWETNWFRMLALALGFGLVLGSFQWRVWNIKQQQRQLEIQVDERTRALQASETALRQAKQTAEAANQAKSAFLASMSHELRTPLNTVLGYTQILRDRSVSERDLQQGLQTIERSGDQLLVLINDVLDIAKIEAGRIELRPTDFSLSDLLGEVAEIIRLRAEQKGLAFHFETATFTSADPPTLPASAPPAGDNPDLPASVHGDARRLRQVLLNLLTNAVKFTHEGEVTLRVSRVAPPSHMLRFQVADTGQGIAAHDSERIFEPFQQASNPQQSSEGVGLGLTISRHLVQIMGGDLRVVSAPGQGSIFWFDLPLPETAETRPAQDQQRRISAVQGRQPRILVIDDVADNRAILVKKLAPLGFVVQEASDAASGLEHAVAHHPEALIVDLRLPDRTGLELIHQLREQPACKETVIIASSASVFAEDWHQSMDAGANDFLPKPIKMPQLLEMLGHHLRLQWCYADDNAPEQPVQRLIAEQVPPPDELARLYELATMGHAAALQRQAVELTRTDERYATFAGEVERLARALQMNELCTFLEQYLER